MWLVLLCQIGHDEVYECVGSLLKVLSGGTVGETILFLPIESRVVELLVVLNAFLVALDEVDEDLPRTWPIEVPTWDSDD
jgi:predicted ATP-dependent Lon-type protease